MGVTVSNTDVKFDDLKYNVHKELGFLNNSVHTIGRRNKEADILVSFQILSYLNVARSPHEEYW